MTVRGPEAIAWVPPVLDDLVPPEPAPDLGLPAVDAAILPSPIRLAAEVPIVILAAVIVAFVVKTFVAQPFYIPSPSMSPQLRINDKVLVSKTAYELHAPRRGDIVVFDAPPGVEPAAPVAHRSAIVTLLRRMGEAIGVIQPSAQEFIKRVIALPGETVEARGGRVYVDGHLLVEPYLPPGTYTTDFAPATVPAGRLWVMGDNRGDSCDSRCFQAQSGGRAPPTIAVRHVVGRAVLKVWPLGHTSFL